MNTLKTTLFLASILKVTYGFSPSSLIGGRQRTTSDLKAFVLDGGQMLTAIDQFYETQPYFSAFLTCSLKASAADIVAQSNEGDDEESKPIETAIEESESSVDVRRNLGLTLYGGLYSGLVQQYLYNTLFPQVFGDGNGLVTVLEQVAADMLVLTPFLCLPVCYAVKAGFSEGKSLPDGIQKYVSHVQHEGLLAKYWAVWIPAQCLTFGVIPQHLRIPFVALVSFFWFIILSNVSSLKEKTA